MGWEKSDDNIMLYITEWRLWWRWTHHITNFNELRSDPLSAIHDIIMQLNIEVSPVVIFTQLCLLGLPATGEYAKTGGYHPVTLLHPNHY